MGMIVPSSSPECQELRLKIKTLGQQMKRIAVEGTGLSPWEAEVLIESIDEVYFSDPELKGLNAGQLKYSCVSADEGAGKPLSACRMTTVMLTLIDAEDRHELPPSGKLASVHRRQRKIMRLTDEAREQGGLLTQEDLAAILDTDVRTVRRDIRDLDQAGVTVATRGQQKDIGPGVSHRGAAIRLWLEGKEPVEIARQIKHSIKAVENYLEKFKRVAYLRRRNFDDYQIALTVGMSVSAVKTYVQIYTDSASRTFLKSRMEEMELVGQQNYFAQDEKKDSTLSKSFGKGGMLR
jgi:DNA-binding CsgD family transcriptional regulator